MVHALLKVHFISAPLFFSSRLQELKLVTKWRFQCWKDILCGSRSLWRLRNSL